MDTIRELFNQVANDGLAEHIVDNQAGRIYQYPHTVQVNWEPSQDLAHNYFSHVSKTKFHVMHSEQSPGYFVLDVLLNNCPMHFFSPKTIVNISRVNKLLEQFCQ